MTFALTNLYDLVVEQFADDARECGIQPVPNLFGWREAGKQMEPGDRITWAPGDDGDMGEDLPVRGPGGNPRKLGSIGELCTIEIQGHDASKPEDERLQYVAARKLYDALRRALYLKAYGTFEIQSTAWVNTKLERRHGATIRLVLAIQAPFFDMPHATAPADASAAIAAKTGDVDSETVTIPGET